jgi:hypothetical protein
MMLDVRIELDAVPLMQIELHAAVFPTHEPSNTMKISSPECLNRGGSEPLRSGRVRKKTSARGLRFVREANS